MQTLRSGLSPRCIELMTDTTTRQPLDHRHRGDVRHLHGGARHHRRQRVAAAHRRQPVGDDRRSDLGADVVSGRQRDHPADDRLARQRLRPQAPADALGRRLHRRVVSVRPGADARLADRVPHHPGRDRRRAAAAVAGGAARGVPAAGSRQGDGLLGPRHRRRADSRTGARRLADRQLQLALGLLHQHPGRHRVARHDEAVHLRSAVPAAANRGRSTTGASACSPSASARCRSCSTRARRTTGSRRASITTLAIISAVTLVALVIHELHDRRSGRRSARVQGAQLRRRRVPDDGASASCCTAAWCCCRSCCRRCSAIRRCRPASRWRRAASDRSS